MLSGQGQCCLGSQHEHALFVFFSHVRRFRSYIGALNIILNGAQRKANLTQTSPTSLLSLLCTRFI